jgi:hypothetical protein
MMELKEEVENIDLDCKDLYESINKGVSGVNMKLTNFLEEKEKKHLADVQSLKEARETELASLENKWENEKQGVLDQLKKVEEELHRVKAEHKELEMLRGKPVCAADCGGGGRSVDEGDLYFASESGTEIVRKFLRFVSFDEDKVEEMVEMSQDEEREGWVGRGYLSCRLGGGSRREIVRELLKFTRFSEDKLEEMVEVFIMAEDGY